MITLAVIEEGPERIMVYKLPSQVYFLKDPFDHVCRVDFTGRVNPSVPGSVFRFSEGPLNPFQSSPVGFHPLCKKREMVLEGLPCGG